MSEISQEKRELISEIKQKIADLQEMNEDIWTSSKAAALNEMAIAKHYETIAKLLEK